MPHKAFTLIELIFVIVIIGILSVVAIPKFRHLTAHAKTSAELATMSSVATALDNANGEWAINEGSFTWGNNQPSSKLNANGYPDTLNTGNNVFGKVIKGNDTKYTKQYSTPSFSIFTGPASNPQNGANYSSNEPNHKPDKNDFWIYDFNKTKCTVSCTDCNQKTLHVGDFALIDVNGSNPTNYSNITCN